MPKRSEQGVDRRARQMLLKFFGLAPRGQLNRDNVCRNLCLSQSMPIVIYAYRNLYE